MTILASALLASLTVALSARTLGREQGTLQQVANRGNLQIEFATPTDCGCTKHVTCIECRNMTDHPTSIRIGALNESTRRTQSMPADAELEICSAGGAPS